MMYLRLRHVSLVAVCGGLLFGWACRSVVSVLLQTVWYCVVFAAVYRVHNVVWRFLVDGCGGVWLSVGCLMVLWRLTALWLLLRG